ncbi:MAG: TIGR00180 family glycosyltransferase [Promethearchaeota archaeon]
MCKEKVNYTLKGKITLIIPTHNRHDHLDRILNYYKTFDIRKLIADSSKEEYGNKNKYDIEYFHYPDVPILVKIADIVKKVKTPYVFMCADDDFIVPESIKKCIDFLENHPDYSSVQGRYIKFIPIEGDVLFKPTYLHCINYHIDAEDPVSRMKQHMSLFMHVIYSIHKTESFQQVYSLLKNFSIEKVGRLVEIAACLIIVINGKHKMIPVFYSGRESNPYSMGATHEVFENIINNPEFSSQYQAFIKLISTHLSKSQGFDIDEAKIYVLEAIDNYINKFLPYFKKFQSGEYEKIKGIKLYLHRLKKLIYQSLEIFFPHTFKILRNREFFRRYAYIFLKNYNEIFKIRRFVLTYPIKTQDAFINQKINFKNFISFSFWKGLINSYLINQ